MTNKQPSPELLAISALFQLQERAWRAKTPEEQAFILVNETHMLSPYRQAVLWIRGKGVLAVSGVPVVEKDAPFIQWMQRLFSNTLSREEKKEARLISPRDLAPEDAEEWRGWLPENGLLLSLRKAGEDRFGFLLLVRDENWTTFTVWLLDHLAVTHGHARMALTGSKRALLPKFPPKKWPLAILAFFLILAAFLPVPLTVLAPAEIVPVSPVVVRSPLEGVVDRIRVRPNQRVEKGDLLFELDRTRLESQLEVARKTLQTVEAEYRQTAQRAMVEQASKAKLAILEGTAEKHRAEMAHLRALIARSRIMAPRDGVIILDDPTEWIGRPVAIGERVMVLADEFHAEVEAWVSIGDAIPLATGAPVKVFLNTDPLHAIKARLHTFSYQAVPRPDGNLAHRVRATLDDTEQQQRIGLRGTARLTGQRVALAYWLFRRPWAAIRQALGI
uniref:HlyD family secretion protein n=1 Tax=Candidatus Kentrum sp. DK TaxID=2126562 RepID=A0A450SK52_9GAMM|nr:MAG: HlyD family secretion protein [Candidatus Kentron sp. DK]